MEPSPGNDRRAPAPPKQEAPRGSDAGQRASPPGRKTGADAEPQRPPARERFFAPGEDGECH